MSQRMVVAAPMRGSLSGAVSFRSHERPGRPSESANTSTSKSGDSCSMAARRLLIFSPHSRGAPAKTTWALPRDPAATYWHGCCLRRAGFFDQALAEVDAALAAGFTQDDAGAVRASILYRLGKFQEALAIRDREVAARPDDPEEHAYARAKDHAVRHQLDICCLDALKPFDNDLLAPL